MEMESRPTIINRAPTLWKHSILAVKPKLRAGKTLQVNSLWESSVNMDYDGDSALNTIVYRVKVTEESQGLSLTSAFDCTILDGKSVTNQPNTGEHTMPFTDTNIRYAEGLINLQDFPRIEESKREEGNKEMYDVPAGVEVLSVMNGAREWLPVTEYSIHKGLKIYEVETNSKRTIHCSGDDSLITIDADLNYIKARPKVGMSIPRVVDCMNMKDNSNELTELIVSDPSVKDSVTFKLDRDFGWVGGAFCGDGWINKKGYSVDSKCRNQVMTCKVDAPFREKWMDIITGYTPNQHFSLVDQPHDFDGTDAFSQKLTLSNPILRNYFRDYHGHSAVGKSLPTFWTRTSEEYRWGLLAGLIDSDGTVSEVKAKAKKYSQIMVVYTSVSKSLIFEIVALANSLGLTASAFFSKMTVAGNESWGATFTVGSILKMQKNLVLHHGEKKDRLAAYKARDTTLAAVDSMTYTPRISHDRIKELNKVIKRKAIYKTQVIDGKQVSSNELAVPEEEVPFWKGQGTIKTTLCQLVKRNSVMTLATAKKIIALNLPIFETSAFWAKWKKIVQDETIVWEDITSLRLIPELTTAYDITAPPNFTMVTESGFVIQDTMQVHLPITDEAVEEAKTMFPSKLLFSDKKKNHLLMMPSQEPITGLYAVTKNLSGPHPGPVKKFISEAMAWAAYYKGELKMTDNIEIG